MKITIDKASLSPNPDVALSLEQSGDQINIIATTSDGRAGLIGFFQVNKDGKIQCESVCYDFYKTNPQSLGNLFVLDRGGWVDYQK